MSLSLEEVKEIAKAAVKEVSLSKEDIELVVAVKETLVTLGVDASEPLKMQNRFQSLRTSGKSKGALGKKIIMFILGAILSGIAGYTGITPI